MGKTVAARKTLVCIFGGKSSMNDVFFSVHLWTGCQALTDVLYLHDLASSSWKPNVGLAYRLYYVDGKTKPLGVNNWDHLTSME